MSFPPRFKSLEDLSSSQKEVRNLIAIQEQQQQQLLESTLLSKEQLRKELQETKGLAVDYQRQLYGQNPLPAMSINRVLELCSDEISTEPQTLEEFEIQINQIGMHLETLRLLQSLQFDESLKEHHSSNPEVQQIIQYDDLIISILKSQKLCIYIYENEKIKLIDDRQTQQFEEDPEQTVEFLKLKNAEIYDFLTNRYTQEYQNMKVLYETEIRSLLEKIYSLEDLLNDYQTHSPAANQDDKVQELEKSLIALTTKINELEKTNILKETEIQRLKQETQQLTQAINEKDSKQKLQNFEKLQAENKSLKEQIKKLIDQKSQQLSKSDLSSAVQNENKSLQDQIQKLNLEKSQLKAEVNRLSDQLQIENTEAHGQFENLKEQIKLTAVDIQSLYNQLKSPSKEIQLGHSKKALNKNKNLQIQISNPDILKISSLFQDLMNQVIKLQELDEQKRAQISQLLTEIKALKTLNQRQSQDEISRQQQELQQLKDQIKQLQKSNSQSNEQKDLSKTENNLKFLENQNKELREQLTKSKIENKQLAELIVKLEKEINKISKQISKLQQELESKQELLDSKKDSERIEQRVKKELQDVIDRKSKELEQARKQLDNKSAELEKAREVKMASTKQIPEKPQSVEQNAPKGAIPSLEGLLEKMAQLQQEYEENKVQYENELIPQCDNIRKQLSSLNGARS